jgi:heme/copper-type cytochrome/quinol oxidase subunit 2
MEENSENNQTAENTETTKGMNWLYIVLALAIVFVGGYLYMNQSRQNTKTTTANNVSNETTTQAMPANGSDVDETVVMGAVEDIKVVEVVGGSFYFKPNEIVVKKGEKVKIVLNSADMMHDFVVDELAIKSSIVKSGETGEVEFIATEAGEYEFYCSVGNHKAMGMVGTLIVEE